MVEAILQWSISTSRPPQPCLEYSNLYRIGREPIQKELNYYSLVNIVAIQGHWSERSVQV